MRLAVFLPSLLDGTFLLANLARLEAIPVPSTGSRLRLFFASPLGRCSGSVMRVEVRLLRDRKMVAIMSGVNDITSTTSALEVPLSDKIGFTVCISDLDALSRHLARQSCGVEVVCLRCRRGRRPRWSQPLHSLNGWYGRTARYGYGW
jgi:hypothetical protein